MSATATATEQEHRCSCGRTFAHEISLKRHRWVTGHAEAEAQAAGAPVAAAAAVSEITPVATAPATAAPLTAGIDAEETYRQAVTVLLQKRMEFEAEEARQAQVQARQALVREFFLWLQSGLMAILGFFGQGAQALGQATATAAGWTLKMAVVGLVCLGLLFAGMGMGRLLASSASAETTVSASR